MKKLTVITGANSGNGQAIALELAKEGYPLLLLDLELETIKKQLSGKKNIQFSTVDVTNYENFSTAVTNAEKTLGPVENMINNAGIMNLEHAEIQDPRIIAKQNAININGVMFGTQIALKSMKKKKSGTIINMSSIAGFKPFPNHSAYVGTKYAVRGYSETVRTEVALDNIRVAVISPGVIKTHLLDGTTNKRIKSEYEKWRDDNAAFINVNDIARIVKFILEQPQNVLLREIVIAPTTQVE